MLLIDTYLDRSPVQGIGVFAKQKVATGDVVWRLDLNFDRLIAVDVYEAQTGPVKAYLDRYAYPHRADPRFIIFEADDARYMNHADDPNCDVSQVDIVTARRDIAVGEELTCDYNLFFAEAGFEFLGDRHL